MWCDLSHLSPTQLIEFRENPTQDICRRCKGRGAAKKKLFGIPGLIICGHCWGSGHAPTFNHRQ